MSTTTATDAFIMTLNNLFTRSYYSAAGYVFESQPFAHDEDDDALRQLREIRKQERQHARMLAQILESLDRVPEPGAFPYWYRDLNYLTVPYLTGFVIEALETDLGMYDDALEITPEAMGLARTMLDAIRAEKAVMLEELRPVAAEAKEKEAARYAAGIAEVKKARAKRLAEEKAKREAMKKGGAVPAAVAGMPDPDEPGISNKEKAKRYVLRMRALKKAGGAAAPAAGPSFEDWAKGEGLLDPEEDGIPNKEKGKRKVLWNRGKKKFDELVASGALGGGGGGAGAGAPSYEEWAKSEGLLDPNEDGIDNKEKGKRRVLWNRSKKKYEELVASGALGGGGGGGPSFEEWAQANGVLDPDEDGIDNKEKGKRKVLWNRAKKKYEKEMAEGAASGGGGQTFEQYAAANNILDPEEAGIDNKEKGKRKVLWNRAKKKWEAEQNG